MQIRKKQKIAIVFRAHPLVITPQGRTVIKRGTQERERGRERQRERIDLGLKLRVEQIWVLGRKREQLYTRSCNNFVLLPTPVL